MTNLCPTDISGRDINNIKTPSEEEGVFFSFFHMDRIEASEIGILGLMEQKKKGKVT